MGASNLGRGDYQQVVVDPFAVDQLGERANDAEFFRFSMGLLDREPWLLVAAFGQVCLELRSEPLVRTDVDVLDSIVRLEFVVDALDDGRLPEREEHLWSVSRDRPQPRGVPTADETDSTTDSEPNATSDDPFEDNAETGADTEGVTTEFDETEVPTSDPTAAVIEEAEADSSPDDTAADASVDDAAAALSSTATQANSPRIRVDDHDRDGATIVSEALERVAVEAPDQ